MSFGIYQEWNLCNWHVILFMGLFGFQWNKFFFSLIGNAKRGAFFHLYWFLDWKYICQKTVIFEFWREMIVILKVLDAKLLKQSLIHVIDAFRELYTFPKKQKKHPETLNTLPNEEHNIYFAVQRRLFMFAFRCRHKWFDTWRSIEYRVYV